MADGTALALVSRTGGVDLVLVDPGGERRVVRSWEDTGGETANAVLDWSPDGRQALVRTFRMSEERAQLVTVDLGTGVQQPLAAEGEVSFLAGSFTRPTGANLVVAGGDDQHRTLERRDRSGALLASIGDVRGLDYVVPSRWWLSLPDGTALVLADPTGIAVHRNDGTLVRTVSVSPADGPCWPVRWWDSARVLAACVEPHGEATTWQRLWLVPVGGGDATPLSPVGTDDLPVVDFGYSDALHVDARTFLQWTGDCGAAAVMEQRGDRVVPLEVASPDRLPVEGVFLQGAADGRLMLLLSAGCGGDGGRLVSTDLDGGDVRLLVPAVDDMLGVADALVWPVR